MKLVMVKTVDEADKLLTVTFTCHINKKSPHRLHCHTLSELNGIKVNSALKITAGDEVAKGYGPAVINRNMQGIKWQGNAETLKNAGGIGFNLQTVHNAGGAFKKAHPDLRQVGAKEAWQDQLNECVDSLQAAGSDVLAEKLEATRFDGEKSHAVVFAKRSRLRTLMRRGHLTLMDSTHNTNSLKWKLFTLMIRMRWQLDSQCPYAY